MSGVIFNIQKFSIHDGPGIRTTVFLKGCPLRCEWCANPESQLPFIQVLYDYDKCIHCHHCLETCPNNAVSLNNDKININFKKCTGCLKCVKECPNKALSNEGEYKEVQEIVDICMQDIDFYEESNGGITISGGEGMSQPDFLKELIPALKEHHLHLAIETTGYIKPEIFKELSPMFDLLLFDVKHYDSKKHQLQTGVKNELIINNLKWAHKQNIEILPRIPIIPGFNDTLNDASNLADLLNEIGLTKVQLLPFHQMGEKKYQLLNRNYKLKNIKALHPEDLKDYQQIFINKGLEVRF